MFDPTAFDNMKVVIEGALYDFDLDGEIIITDRNDLVNLAKMSRSFDVSFQLPEKIGIAKLEMESTLMNLAAELLPESSMQKQSGCHIKLYFYLEEESAQDYKEIDSILISIWGETRKFTQIVQYNPLQGPNYRKSIITVEFDRLIGEEHMEDLVQMIDFMISTLQRLQS
jgi:hypothetical protein